MNTNFDWSRTTKSGHGLAAVALLAMSAILGTSAAHAQSVANGNGSFTGGISGTTELSPTTLPTGWSSSGTSLGGVIGDTCVISGTTWCTTTTWGNATTGTKPTSNVLVAPAVGNYYVDPFATADAEILSTTITGLTSGSTYTLSFLESGFTLNNACDGTAAHPCNGTTQTANPYPGEWLVSIGGAAGQQSTQMTIPISSPMSWTLVSMTFVANLVGNATSEALSFVTKGASPTVSQFAALANVSVAKVTTGNSVPEPASLALLGFGMAGIAGLRRRRAQAAA